MTHFLPYMDVMHGSPVYVTNRNQLSLAFVVSLLPLASRKSMQGKHSLRCEGGISNFGGKQEMAGWVGKEKE